MGLFVKRRVGKVDVFLVHLLLGQTHRLAEALEVNDLPLTQEADDVVDIRIVGHAQDVVVGNPGLLLWYYRPRETF